MFDSFGGKQNRTLEHFKMSVLNCALGLEPLFFFYRVKIKELVVVIISFHSSQLVEQFFCILIIILLFVRLLSMHGTYSTIHGLLILYYNQEGLKCYQIYGNSIAWKRLTVRWQIDKPYFLGQVPSNTEYKNRRIPSSIIRHRKIFD